MEEHYGHFEYRKRETVPKEFRQVDWTYVSLRDKPFSECKEVFDRLKKDLEDAFAGKPFFHLHLLRAIEDRLLRLAMYDKQPLSECLEGLRRRLELEYCRVDIPGKAAMAVVLSDYAVECGEVGLARLLLDQERAQLRELQETCSACLDTIDQRLAGLRD